jgi:hypothetical protein
VSRQSPFLDALTRHEYAASAVPQTLWRFLRDTPLTPPGWLQIAATVSPFIGWLGLLAIQVWVDRQFGAVTSQRSSRDCPRRGPRWLAMLAIAAWAVVWGRRSMQGVMRFPGFLKVRADLAAIQPVDE